MRVTRFFGARLTWEDFDKSGLAVHQALQGRLHFAEFIEVMHALSTAAQLARRLRAAQQEFAHNGGFAAIEVEGVLKAMLIFGDASIGGADGAHQGVVLQNAKRGMDGVALKIHDWIAIGFLIARVDQRI